MADKIDFDLELPPLSIFDISIDAVGMDMGRNTHYDLTDFQAMGALRRLRWKYKARMDYLDREIDRLEKLNEKTDHKVDELRVDMARAERYFREQYPRELEIALAEAGIVAK
jgi:hypothetical protein